MPKLAQKMIIFFFRTIASRVRKNHLFEQEHEREPHPPLQLEKPDMTTSMIRFASAQEIKKALSSHVGWQLVHHWATWCDGCMEEIDDIEKFSAQLAQEGVSTKGISWELFNGTPPQHAIPVVRHVHLAHSLSFPTEIVQDAPDNFFAVLGLSQEQIPQTALYKNGACVFSHMGILTQEQQEEIDTMIKGHTDE